MAEPSPSRKPFSDPEAARAAAKKSWESRRAKQAAAEAASADAPETGLPAGVDERDRALALRELRKLVKAPGTADAVKVQAAKVLAGVEEQKTTARPPSVERLEGLTVDELERLVLAHC